MTQRIKRAYRRPSRLTTAEKADRIDLYLGIVTLTIIAIWVGTLAMMWISSF